MNKKEWLLLIIFLLFVLFLLWIGRPYQDTKELFNTIGSIIQIPIFSYAIYFFVRDSKRANQTIKKNTDHINKLINHINMLIKQTGIGKNKDINAIQSAIINPEYAQYTSPIRLVNSSDIGEIDNTWKNQGNQIDCRGYKTLGIWVALTVNDSIKNDLQVVSKTECNNINTYALEETSEYKKKLGNNNIKIFYKFNIGGIPYIQIQTKAENIKNWSTKIGTIDIEYILSQ